MGVFRYLNAIIKRDGQVVPYDRHRITQAIFKAAAVSGGFDFDEAERLSRCVELRTTDSYAEQVPTVEDLQDIVESVLMEAGHVTTARNYIIYHHQRTEVREARHGAVEGPPITSPTSSSMKCYAGTWSMDANRWRASTASWRTATMPSW